ncbi:hypothetical protein L9F63_013656, partial [Diploptera punctata]
FIRVSSSLKVKLMLRRPITQLVAQGIMPPLKTPPAFHEQRQKLERAKMGDLLKAKIQQRPDRQELVRQHILEDPSLAERQRMLKKARLADSLNDQLSHRPGPLELIKKNILHTEEPIERAVKEGVIPFKATCEGQLTKPQHPKQIHNIRRRLADEATTVRRPRSSSSICRDHQHQQTATVTFAELCNNVMSGNAQLPSTPSLPTILPLASTPSPMSLGSTTSSLSPLSSVSVSSPPAPPTPSPALTITPRPAPQPSPISIVSSHRTDAPGKDKNRKKSKSKSQPKTRTIKFHEYKGPPNAHKSTAMSAASHVETSYELLLQQQQLFLQWQLEWQHKKPLSVNSDSVSSGNTTHTVATTGTSATSTVTVATPSSNSAPVPSPAASSTPQEQPQQPTLRTLTKLEDMKVSDLKAELKKRNLPVSGSKPQLIERLKPFTESQQDGQVTSSTNTTAVSTSTTATTAATTIPVTQVGHILMDTPGQVISEESLSGLSMETPVSPPNQQMSLVLDEHVSRLKQQQGSPQPPSPQQQQALVSEDIIRDQQRKIEELQRELLKSQLQLQQIRNSKEVNNSQRLKQPQTLISPTGFLNGLYILILQFRSLSPSSTNELLDQVKILKEPTRFIGPPIKGRREPPRNDITPSRRYEKQKVAALNGVSGHQRTSSLPNFFGSFVTQQQIQSDSSKDLMVTKPPPQYEEATKQLKVKQETDPNTPGCKSNSSRPKNVKSQIVDDVLEILIKNGELPPSAAQDPATPTTPGRSMPQGLVFTSPTSTTETPTPASSPPVPPPPPPPPLPHTTFAITLPTAISLTSHANNNPFSMQFSGTDSLDFILGNVDTSSSLSDGDGQQQQHVHALVANADLQGPPPNIDLKELGLDLETLDPMDFGQLDCSDLGVPVVKMEPADLLDTVTHMEIGGDPGSSKITDQQACELMDIGEMPMDMDDADWLESLMPPPDGSVGGSGGDVEGGNSIMTPPHQPSYLVSSNAQGNFHFNHNHLHHNGHSNVELDSYDPLLSNSQDPFDLFNIEESEFKMAGDLNAALGWSDKVDFAT